MDDQTSEPTTIDKVIATRPQRNNGPLLIGGVLLLVLALGGYLAHLVAGGADKPKPQAVLSNSELLMQAASSMKAATSYHVEVVLGSTSIAYSTTLTETIAGDVDVVGNISKLVFSTTSAIATVVSTDKGNYYHRDDGTYEWASYMDGYDKIARMWQNLSLEELEQADFQPEDGNPLIETIDGVECRHITASLADTKPLIEASGGNVDNSTGLTELWISTDTPPLVQQLKITTTGVDSLTTVTMRWSRFGAQFDIEQPVIIERTPIPLPIETGEPSP